MDSFLVSQTSFPQPIEMRVNDDPSASGDIAIKIWSGLD